MRIEVLSSFYRAGARRFVEENLGARAADSGPETSEMEMSFRTVVTIRRAAMVWRKFRRVGVAAKC